MAPIQRFPTCSTWVRFFALRYENLSFNHNSELLIECDSYRVLAAGRVGDGVVDVLLVLVGVGDGAVIGIAVGGIVHLGVGSLIGAVPVRHELQGDDEVVEHLNLLKSQYFAMHVRCLLSIHRCKY